MNVVYLLSEDQSNTAYTVRFSTSKSFTFQNVPVEFVKAMLNTRQLKKFAKGQLQFVVEWGLFYEVMYVFFKAYCRASAVLEVDKFYGLKRTFDYPHVVFKEKNFNTKDEYETWRSQAEGESPFWNGCMSGREIIDKSAYNWGMFGCQFYTNAESEAFKKNILTGLQKVNELLFHTVEFDSEFNVKIVNA